MLDLDCVRALKLVSNERISLTVIKKIPSKAITKYLNNVQILMERYFWIVFITKLREDFCNS